MDCIFCKIIAGEIPCHKVYEDEHVLAFLDIYPHAKGHTVVVPKVHHEDISDFNAIEWSNFSLGLYSAMQRVDAILEPDGYNVGVNDRPAAGQVIPHVHWHIFPRWKNDGGGSMHTIIKSEEKIDVEEIAKLFA